MLANRPRSPPARPTLSPSARRRRVPFHGHGFPRHERRNSHAPFGRCDRPGFLHRARPDLSVRDRDPPGFRPGSSPGPGPAHRVRLRSADCPRCCSSHSRSFLHRVPGPTSLGAGWKSRPHLRLLDRIFLGAGPQNHRPRLDAGWTCRLGRAPLGEDVLPPAPPNSPPRPPVECSEPDAPPPCRSLVCACASGIAARSAIADTPYLKLVFMLSSRYIISYN